MLLRPAVKIAYTTQLIWLCNFLNKHTRTYLQLWRFFTIKSDANLRVAPYPWSREGNPLSYFSIPGVPPLSFHLFSQGERIGHSLPIFKDFPCNMCTDKKTLRKDGQSGFSPTHIISNIDMKGFTRWKQKKTAIKCYLQWALNWGPLLEKDCNSKISN